MYKNGGGPRYGNICNIGNVKQKKNNSPYIPEDFWNKIKPEIRKIHIEASKKGRPYQQIYGI